MLRFSMHIGNRTPSTDASSTMTSTHTESGVLHFDEPCSTCDTIMKPHDILKCPCGLAVYCSSVCQAKAWPTHQTRCSAARRQQTVQICSQCRRTSTTMHGCRCGQTFYCNHDCQKKHWFRHAHMCASLIHKQAATYNTRVEHKSIQVGDGDTSSSSSSSSEDDISHHGGQRLSNATTGQEKQLVIPTNNADESSCFPATATSPKVSAPAVVSHLFVEEAEIESFATLPSQSADVPLSAARRRTGSPTAVSTQLSLHRSAIAAGAVANIAYSAASDEEPHTTTIVTGQPIVDDIVAHDGLDAAPLSSLMERVAAGALPPIDLTQQRHRRRKKPVQATLKYTAKNPYVSKRAVGGEGGPLSPLGGVVAPNPFTSQKAASNVPTIEVTVPPPQSPQLVSGAQHCEHGFVANDDAGATPLGNHNYHLPLERLNSAALSSQGIDERRSILVAVYTDTLDPRVTAAPFRLNGSETQKKRKVSRTAVLVVPR